MLSAVGSFYYVRLGPRQSQSRLTIMTFQYFLCVQVKSKWKKKLLGGERRWLGFWKAASVNFMAACIRKWLPMFFPVSQQLSRPRQDGPSERLFCPEGYLVMLHCLMWVQTNQNGTFDWQPAHSSTSVFNVQCRTTNNFKSHSPSVLQQASKVWRSKSIKDHLSSKEMKLFVFGMEFSWIAVAASGCCWYSLKWLGNCNH